MPFDALATDWDTPRRIDRAKIIAERIAREITHTAASALEFGCGTGLISFCLSDKLSAISLMDSSPGMIDQLRLKIAEAKIPNMHPVLHDLTQAPHPAKYDIIYSSMALHHISDIPAILLRLHDSLNPRGTLCIVDLDGDDGTFHSEEPDFSGHHGFAHGELAAWLAQTGFADIHTKTFYRGTKRIGGRDAAYSLFCAAATKG